nr:hypothetical protein [Marinicella sp. W31]MDC2877194.1 hypothetical protein [Marinicella sp. W31]
MAWRSIGERAVRFMMNSMGIYRDDHESSTWHSLTNQLAAWTVVQAHLKNGSVLEANFGLMKPMPRTPIIINDDGIAVYVTGVYRADGTSEQFDITGNDSDITITYLPRSEINRIDISWQIHERYLNKK